MLQDPKIGLSWTPAIQSAEINYYAVLTQKTDLLRQIRETENSLSLLIGDQAHSYRPWQAGEPESSCNFSTGVGIQLLNNRADVHAAEMNLAQCFYGIETARSKFYPSITISGTGAFTNSGWCRYREPRQVVALSCWFIDPANLPEWPYHCRFEGG